MVKAWQTIEEALEQANIIEGLSEEEGSKGWSEKVDIYGGRGLYLTGFTK